MKTMLQLPVVAAFALAPVLCTPALSATPEAPIATVDWQSDYPYAAVRDASSVTLEYWSDIHGNRTVTVSLSGKDGKRLAEIFSHLQTNPDYGHPTADIDYADWVIVYFNVDGKRYAVFFYGVDTRSHADNEETQYFLSDEDYAEAVSILRAHDPFGIIGL